MSDATIIIGLEEDFDSKLKEGERAVKKFRASMVTSVRRVAMVGIAMSTMFGGFLDQTYTLGIEAGLLSIELFTTISAAESIATMGASALFKAGASAAAIISMLIAIANLRSGNANAARKSQGAVQTFRLLSF